MTRQDIISNLYTSKDVDDCIAKMVQAKYRQDFKQELFLIISSVDEILISKLYQEQKIKYYVVRVIINLSRQKRNVFHRKYIIPETHCKLIEDIGEPPAEQECFKERQKKEEQEAAMVNRVHDLDQEMNTPAYRLMALLVAKFGSQQEVSRVTGINQSVISRGLKKVRAKICL
jgi:hypothetical protein